MESIGNNPYYTNPSINTQHSHIEYINHVYVMCVTRERAKEDVPSNGVSGGPVTMPRSLVRSDWSITSTLMRHSLACGVT